MRRLVRASIIVCCLACGGSSSAQPKPSAAPQLSLDRPALTTSRALFNRPLLVAGLLMFGGAYAASVVDAAMLGRDVARNDLYYPVVGPWMAYANRCDPSRRCSGDEPGGGFLLVIDGVGQGLGAVALVTSLLVPEETTRRWFFLGDGGFHAGPSRVGAGYGIGAAGVF